MRRYAIRKKPGRLITAGLALIAAALFLRAVLPEPSPTKEKDVVFFIASDTHYTKSPSRLQANRALIRRMNALPGRRFPRGMGGGRIPEPRGVVLLGDLVDDGDEDTGAGQWAAFTADYGLKGERLLRFPVFEGCGNHDGGDNDPVRKGIRKRNPQRAEKLRISPDGLHYSWDWGGVHFVHLNMYPGSEKEAMTGPDGRRIAAPWMHPRKSLEFLVEDLAVSVGDSGRPVVLFQHYGWDEWGRAWWTDEERGAFHEAVEDYAVLAVFWGHSHAVLEVDWRRIPTFCVGAAQYDPRPGVFLVIKISRRGTYIGESREKGWGRIWYLPRKRPPTKNRPKAALPSTERGGLRAAAAYRPPPEIRQNARPQDWDR